MRNINSIIIHCTGSDLYAKPIDIRNYHLSLGWKNCGYHFLIDHNGFVFLMRPIDQVGAHCKGQNENSIGIALIGGKDRFNFTFDQLLSLLALTKRLSVTYKIPKSFIFGHNDFNKNKACPQFNVKNFIKYEKGYFKKDS